MDQVTGMTHAERQRRMSIRNFLLTADENELQLELEISRLRRDEFRENVIRELMDEK